MSKDYRNILQIGSAVDPRRLEQAYRVSQERYVRLTSKGPLRHYRHELLQDTREAWEALKGGDRLEISTAGRRLEQGAAAESGEKAGPMGRPMSVVARRVAKQRGLRVDRRGPVVSRIKDPEEVRRFVKVEGAAARAGGSRAAGGEGRRLSIPGARELVLESKMAERYDRKELEDWYCKEVMYRLEGDMIRYSSRQELLALASAWQIPLFRANLLMAQIVESVRSHGLYRPTAREKALRRAGKREGDSVGLAAVVAFCVLSFVLLDVLVMLVMR